MLVGTSVARNRGRRRHLLTHEHRAANTFDTPARDRIERRGAYRFAGVETKAGVMQRTQNGRANDEAVSERTVVRAVRAPRQSSDHRRASSTSSSPTRPLERTRNRHRFPDGRIDVVEEVRRWVGRVEVHRLGRVDLGPPADGHDPVHGRRVGKFNRVAERQVGWFDTNPIVQHRRHTRVVERRDHRPHRCEARQVGIGDDQRSPNAEIEEAIPTSRVTPGPKRTLEAANSKAISRFIWPDSCDAPSVVAANAATPVVLDPQWTANCRTAAGLGRHRDMIRSGKRPATNIEALWKTH